MPKLIWVMLPLLAVAAWLAWCAARRRWPPRPRLNAVLALLLLAYVGTTAGLGIFWVAQQQLPVFDWHYLFGYATVLLVAVHLGFNLRAAWRGLSARSRGTPPPWAVPARRQWLGTGGVLLAAAAAFVLGLRHGRSELRLQWPAAEGAGGGLAGGGAGSGGAGGMATVERLHAWSAVSRQGVLLRAPAVDWGEAPPPFKSYPGAARLVLPPPASAAAGGGPGLVRLAWLLWHTAGVTARRGALALRASPSSGALFSTELYLVVPRALPGLAAGLWHHDAEHHLLERLPDGSAVGEAMHAALGGADTPGAFAWLVAGAVFRRTGHKYRDRSYRYLLADLGHTLENLRQIAAENGGHALLLPRFDEARIAALLRLDEAEEGVLAVAALHDGAPPAAAAAAPGWQPPPAPQEAAGLALGVTGAMHLATSLRVATAVAAGAPLPAAALPLPPAAPAPMPVAQRIAQRRSQRRFAATPLPAGTLGALLHAALAATPPLLSAALRVDVVAHAVAGVPAGAWRYEARRHVLLPRRPEQLLRAASRAAALDQDVIGDAAAVLVVAADRATIAADPAGAPRGWRHAFIEAGLAGERVYLEGTARGVGVCSVGAFYDDEAAALVALDSAREWVLHFVAVGLPA